MVRGLAVAGLTMLALTGVAAQQRAPFRAATDLVVFAVTVTDRDGAIVTDLTPDDFEVVENGKPQTITHFARSDDADAPALHLGLLLDTSDSMVSDLEISQTAAIRFLDRVPEAVDLTLVQVDSEVRVSRFGQDDFLRLVERIRSTETDGYTALYDALAVYLDGAAADDGRSVLVAFTDGGDSRSALDYGGLVDIVKGSTATVYVIGLLENARSDHRDLQRVRLMRIAEESGGQAIFPTSLRQIESAYDRILAEVRGQYTLGYVSTDTQRDGGWRDVEVRLKDPARRDLRVRTRAGYLAPLGDRP